MSVHFEYVSSSHLFLSLISLCMDGAAGKKTLDLGFITRSRTKPHGRSHKGCSIIVHIPQKPSEGTLTFRV